MRLLSKDEVKAYELNILLDVKRFCQENNIRFYLSGGTLLGAIRHQGFIPWDDDIDICMPRPDYDRFVRVFRSNKGYVIKSNALGNWDNPFAKVIDPTTVVESNISENEFGLWIDVFPVDGLPNSLSETKKLYRKVSMYRGLFSCGYSTLGTGKTIWRKYAKYILKPLAITYGLKKLANKIEILAHTYPYEKADFVGAVTWGLYGMGERMKKSEFEKTLTVNFEGHKFPAFSCWDSYLHGLYNDYMQLPPIEKRQTHSMKVYLLE